jgi:hypothetical protein
LPKSNATILLPGIVTIEHSRLAARQKKALRLVEVMVL